MRPTVLRYAASDPVDVRPRSARRKFRRCARSPMTRCLQLVTCLVLGCAGTLAAFGQADTDIESPKHKAWDMLMTAAFSKRTVDRTNGIRSLGLLRENTRARELAENALSDPNPDVRVAAATALGQMHATAAIPKLQKVLSDKKIPVVMAAAHSLRELDDNKSAYEVYYDLLTGERKSNDGIIAQQINTLKDPKELAKIGFSEGIGYIPFAGIGWDAYRTMHKKDPNPARAVAATLLAHDPDPASAKALVKATSDKRLDCTGGGGRSHCAARRPRAFAEGPGKVYR